MKKKDIIGNMCFTYRHDFGVLSKEDQEGIANLMEQLYTHSFYPVLEDVYSDIKCGCDHCLITVEDTLREAMGRDGEK